MSEYPVDDVPPDRATRLRWGLAVREFRNPAEAAFSQEAERRGWAFIKRGWPDFFCLGQDGEVVLVEVKPTKRAHLKREQRIVMEALAAKGVRCYRWSPDGGFQVIK